MASSALAISRCAVGGRRRLHKLAQAVLDRRVGHERRAGSGSVGAPSPARRRARRPERCSRRRAAAGRCCSRGSAAIRSSRAMRAAGAGSSRALRSSGLGDFAFGSECQPDGGDAGLADRRRRGPARSPRARAARPRARGTTAAHSAPRRGRSASRRPATRTDLRRGIAVGSMPAIGPSRPTAPSAAAWASGTGWAEQLVDQRQRRGIGLPGLTFEREFLGHRAAQVRTAASESPSRRSDRTGPAPAERSPRIVTRACSASRRIVGSGSAIWSVRAAATWATMSS